MQKIIHILMLVIILISISAFGTTYYRLVETRRQLEHVRLELTTAENKQREIRDIVRGTNEILSESFATFAGIRSQIRVIRESYEAMENLLYSTDADYSGNNNNNNNGENK